jgi:hypothetical protein
MVEYFQLRKNVREVIRIFRGPFEGYDITRAHVWYRKPGGTEYLPGRQVVAFNSEMIPGIREGLALMARKKPEIILPDFVASTDATQPLRAILAAHGRPMHWEVIARIFKEEYPAIAASRWGIYNVLLKASDLFEQHEDDVFALKGG